MSRGEIEFIYFDLGNVLVSFDPEIACRNTADKFGVQVDQARAAIYDSGLQDRFEHGAVTGEQYAESVRHHLSLSAEQMPTAALLEAVSKIFTPIEAMENLVRQVGQGRRTGILSNTCSAHWEWIAKQNWPVVNGGFEVRILSFQVGAMKPAAKIYAAAEAAAGVAPKRILFLDDKIENVQAAIARGWQAAHCVGGTQAAEMLRTFGVLA